MATYLRYPLRRKLADERREENLKKGGAMFGRRNESLRRKAPSNRNELRNDSRHSTPHPTGDWNGFGRLAIIGASIFGVSARHLTRHLDVEGRSEV
jgi:hypothetical protein